MSGILNRFTTKQSALLTSAGIHSMYDFVTQIPFRVDLIEVLDSGKDASQYLWQAVLTRFEQRRSGMYVLHFQGEHRNLQVFYFAKGKYVHSLLKEGSVYQMILTKRNGFWNIHKLAQLRGPLQEHTFILGRAFMRSYILPVYHSSKKLTNTVMRQLHRKLEPSDYLLNLSGLVKNNGMLPQVLDLRGMHHPDSMQEFSETKRAWVMLQFYLHAALQRYLDSTAQDMPALIAKQDVSILKSLSEGLGFELSRSQKEVIWDVVQAITYQNDG